MPSAIRHHLSFRLTARPRLPAHLAGYTQFVAGDKHFSIRGDVSGAPTPQILDALAERGAKLISPVWTFSLEGDPGRAAAFAIELSPSGDRRDVRLLNPRDEHEDPSVAPLQARLRPGHDAVLSRTPEGPLSLVGNNLLASDSSLQALGLTACGSVIVAGRPVGWHVVQPPERSVLDPLLCFSGTDGRPYRAHLANIMRVDTEPAFGVATESEGWGDKLSGRIYLMDAETSAHVIPRPKRALGDVRLTPVFPHDSPEGELMRSVAARMSRLAGQSSRGDAGPPRPPSRPG